MFSSASSGLCSVALRANSTEPSTMRTTSASIVSSSSSDRSEPWLQLLQRVLRLAQLLLLALRPVDLRVADVVADEAVRLRQHEYGALALACVRQRPLGRGMDGFDVLAVHRHRAHSECGRTLGEIRDRQLLVRGRRLGVMVVLADEHRRHQPQLREVESLVEGADVRRAVAEVRDSDPRLAAHLEGERRTGDHRQAPAHDGVRSEIAALHVVQVHRPAVTARHALDLAVELRHQRIGVRSARERVAVGAVRRRKNVSFRHGARHADGDRLLADGDVQEARQLAGAELFLHLLLEAPDEQHLAVERPQTLLREPPFPCCLCLGHEH